MLVVPGDVFVPAHFPEARESSVDVGENAGDTELSEGVILRVDDETVRSHEITLAPGEADRVIYELDTSGLEEGEHTWIVSVGGVNESAEMELEDYNR